MDINYRDAACGVGKTLAEIIRMVTTPAQYLFAVDRRSAIPERGTEIIRQMTAAGTNPEIVAIFSSPDGPLPFLPARLQVAEATMRTSVLAEIAALPDRHAHEPHIIVVVTHEGLKQSDLSGFEGWHLIIDETPTAFECDSACTPAMGAFFTTHYTLKPFGPAHSEVRLRDDTGLTSARLRQDDTLSRWADFHKRVVSRRGLITSLRDWSEMGNGRAWSWWSCWSPLEMAAFDSVTICAHAFRRSLTAIVWESVYGAEINFVPVQTTSSRVWCGRDVLIRYAAPLHTSGSHFWDQPTGRLCLTAWRDWIASEYPEGDRPHLLTSNGKLRSIFEAVRIAGEFPTVRVAGSNGWADIHDASICYAAKVRPAEKTVLESLGVDPGEVTRAREHEDIIQFAMRTSIRDPLSTETVRINVYDYAQASMLAAYLAEHYPAMTVETRLEDIGISHVMKPPVGRPRVEKTEVERQAGAAHRRGKKAESQRKRRAARRKVSGRSHDGDVSPPA